MRSTKTPYYSFKSIILCFLLIFLLFIQALKAQNWDIRLLNKLNSAPSGADRNWQFLSKESGLINLAVPTGLLISGFVKHDENLKKNGLKVGLAYLNTTLITYSMKNIIKKRRPFDTYPDLIYKKSEGGSYSFPSGHTSTAFATATAISLIYPKWYVIAPAYTYAAAVGYSRMYLGVHYPSDVLAGALLGSGTAYLSWKINKALKRKHKA